MEKSEGRQVFAATAWAVELDGKVQTDWVYRTRREARKVQQEVQIIYKSVGMDKTVRVRKVEVRVVPG
jgi:hypothetical protein